MELRRPLGLVFAIGGLGWPVGLFAFGGFDDRAGSIVIVVGSALVLGAALLELFLRGVDRVRRPPSP